MDMQFPATANRKIVLLLLLGTFTFLGCPSQTKPELYIYCNETFWYVMQEEALFFNKIYGFQVFLVPVRSQRTSDTTTEDSIAIDNLRRSPTPWRSMPRSQASNLATDSFIGINADIEQQIERIAEASFGDLFLSDSQKHLDKLQKLALSAKEYPVCYLTLTMLVPKGNPLHIHSVKDALDSHRKLGIIDPSVDGLGEVSWNMLDKIVSGGESPLSTERIRIYERQYDLLEALEQDTIDAALVWNATSQVNFLLVKYSDVYNKTHEKYIRDAERKKDHDQLRRILKAMYNDLIDKKSFAEEVPLTENPEERSVIAVRLAALGTASHDGYCKRFADFMRSKQGKDVLKRFGFNPE